jgi:hypothetical protein
MVVTGCGPLTDDATADPNNNIPEFIETNNTGTATTTATCDTALDKDPSPGAVNTSAGPATVTYTITLTDTLGSWVAPSTVSDTLPLGFIGQSATISPGATGTCTAFPAFPAPPAPPVPQPVTCTNVGGPEPVIITIVAQVPTAVAQADYFNVATVSTTGDSNPVNNVDTDPESEAVSVYPFDVVVSVEDSIDPVLGATYAYTITATNNSVGGFATPAFNVMGDLQLRSANGQVQGPVDGVTTFAAINPIGTTPGCVVGALGIPGGGTSTQQYNCPVPGLLAGQSVAFTVAVDAFTAEPDGFPEVGLDATASDTAPPAGCVGGGTDPICAPEGNFTNAPPAAILLNNRQVEFTDID